MSWLVLTAFICNNWWSKITTNTKHIHVYTHAQTDLVARHTAITALIKSYHISKIPCEWVKVTCGCELYAIETAGEKIATGLRALFIQRKKEDLYQQITWE